MLRVAAERTQAAQAASAAKHFQQEAQRAAPQLSYDGTYLQESLANMKKKKFSPTKTSPEIQARQTDGENIFFCQETQMYLFQLKGLWRVNSTVDSTEPAARRVGLHEPGWVVWDGSDFIPAEQVTMTKMTATAVPRVDVRGA